MQCAKTSLFNEGTFGRVNVLALELAILLLVTGGDVDVMLNRELVAAHMDQMSYDPGIWKPLKAVVKPTPLYVVFFLVALST